MNNSIQFNSKMGLLKHVSQLNNWIAHVNIMFKKLQQIEINKERDIKQDIITIYIVKNTLVKTQ